MSALSGLPAADLQWLIKSGVDVHQNMPPSSLGPIAAVSAQTFLDSSRVFLWRLGYAMISKSDARMLLNTARLWAKVNNAKFAAVPVVEPVWSAEMEAAEMAELEAAAAAELAAAAAAEMAAAVAAKEATAWCSWCGDVEEPFVCTTDNQDRRHPKWNLCPSCVIERRDVEATHEAANKVLLVKGDEDPTHVVEPVFLSKRRTLVGGSGTIKSVKKPEAV